MSPNIVTPYDQNPARIRIIIESNRKKKHTPATGVLIGIHLAVILAFGYLAVMITL
ncbi:MAG: hypothetical protein JEZ11_25325 [Desulfobacterales bacterium]|nr:hypothetical protein [Desulfobacterales bacterium]